MRPSRFIVAMIALLALSGSVWAQDTPAEGGVLRYGLLAEPASFDPHVYSGDQTMVIVQVVYETLVKYDDGNEIVGSLAQSVESPDPKTFVFRLKEGVTFHDGTPLTAEDVKFSLERIIAPGSSATRHQDLQIVDRVEVNDELTVTVHLKDANASFLAFLARPESAIVSKKFVEHGGDLTQTMMGTGPFKFADYERGIRLRVVKNEDYHVAGLPYLEAIDFIPVADDTTRINLLRANQLDVIHFVPWPGMPAIEADRNLTLHTLTDAVMMLHYNVDKPPFDDPRVRKAIGFAVNRDAVIRSAFLGRGTPITGGIIPADHWAHNPELVGTFGFDPAGAREMLEEAGALDARVTISTYSLPFAVQTAEVVQNNLAQIGLQAEIEVMEWPTFLQQTTGERNFQVRVYGAGLRIPDPDFYTPFVGTGGEFSGPAGFGDDLLDALLEEGRTTLDLEQRKQIYRQVEERVLELSPMTFISWRVNAWASRNSVRNLRMLPDPTGPLSGLRLAEVWLAP